MQDAFYVIQNSKDLFKKQLGNGGSNKLEEQKDNSETDEINQVEMNNNMKNPKQYLIKQ